LCMFDCATLSTVLRRVTTSLFPCWGSQSRHQSHMSERRTGILLRKRVLYPHPTDNAGESHQVKCPYFTTVNRGPRHGIQSVVLPTPAGCSRIDLPASSCRVDRKPPSCAECSPGVQSMSTPARQRAPLNFSEFVVDRNGCTSERVNIAGARLLTCDGLCSGEKMLRSSASVDTLQMVRN
jgi:hypothetical protein